jgi:hypothetical protein
MPVPTKSLPCISKDTPKTKFPECSILPPIESLALWNSGAIIPPSLQCLQGGDREEWFQRKRLRQFPRLKQLNSWNWWFPANF